MKAKPISILDDIENDEDLMVGQKFDGFNEELVIEPTSVELVNRSGAIHTANVPSLIEPLKKLTGKDIIIHGEAIAPSGKSHDAKSIFGSKPGRAKKWQDEHGNVIYIAYDIVRYKGENLSHIPFGERLAVLRKALDEIRQESGVSVSQEVLVSYGKKNLFDTVVGRGGEGVVVKKMSGFEKDWFKVKKIHSWDAVIVGFTEGRGKYSAVIGAIRYGFYDTDGNLCETGKCSGMMDVERAMFASTPEIFIGCVVEIKGQELGNRGGIIFPRFVRIRDDKLPIDCLLPTS